MAAREAYSQYVERAVEGANEADGPLSSLKPEALASGDVLLIGVELGVEPARRPSQELGHPGADRLRAVETLAVALTDPRAAQEHVL